MVNILSGLDSSTGNRSIILYSDLGQNSPLYSYLVASDWQLLKQQADSLLERFETYQPLPDLKGTQMQIIYSTSAKELETGFLLHYRLFSQLLEQAGATVSYSTTIKPLNHEE